MNSKEYLDKILEKYRGAFDIESPYSYHDRDYAAYASFSSLSEKYVLVRSAQLWKTEAFEHTLFVCVEKVDEKLIDEMKSVISDYMEPEKARGGEKYPRKDHMYTYLTVVIISDGEVSEAVRKAVKSYRFSKSYAFTFRGVADGRMAVVDLSRAAVYTNGAARPIAKMLRETLQ